MKLPKKVKKDWVAALRSGMFSKTKEKLCSTRGKSFCCLGVLQYTTHKGHIECYEVEGEYRLEFSKAFPSTEYWKAIGATGDVERMASELGKLNDVENRSFKQIADFIDENIEAY